MEMILSPSSSWTSGSHSAGAAQRVRPPEMMVRWIWLVPSKIW